MKITFFCGVTLIFLTIVAWSKSNEKTPKVEGLANGKIIVCGSDKVYIANLETSTKKKLDVVWEWSANNAEDIPLLYKINYFGKMDECKVSADGKRILVTSSAGGVGLINIADKKMMFFAYVPQAHSIEELPGNKIAVASSTNKFGDAIDLFDLNKKEESLFRVDFKSAHGVVWNEQRKTLYAFGGSELRAYALKDIDMSSPSLVLQEKWRQPGNSGHDMQSYPDNNTLILTDGAGVYEHDLNTHLFKPYKPLARQKHLKSISINKNDGRVLYQEPEDDYWAYSINILEPFKNIPVQNMNVYKARWYYGD